MNALSPVDEQIYREVVQFLYREAEVLDNRQFEEWLDMLTADIHYRAPIRVTRRRDEGPEFIPGSTWIDDQRASLEARVRRLNARDPVAEDPPSRTRRFVSNIRVEPAEGELSVKSNLLLYRSTGDSTHYDLFTAEREDVLRRVNGRWKLAHREVLLDQTVLGTQNISVIL